MVTTPRRWLLERLTSRKPALALLLASRRLGVSAFRWTLPGASPLARPGGGEAIELPADWTLAPYVLRHGTWQPEEVGFLVRHAPREPCVLIDVGANVGLMSRQLLHALPQVAGAVCFEPHPLNHALLQRNLAHLPQAVAVRAALGDVAGELTFHEDLDNAGNYSLDPRAVEGKRIRTSTVPCRLADEDALYGPFGPSATALRGLPVVYKSDTQGFDEVIAGRLPMSFWARVQVATMELSGAKRPEAQAKLLAAVLARFPRRRFAHDIERNLEVDEILSYRGPQEHQVDLYLAASA